MALSLAAHTLAANVDDPVGAAIDVRDATIVFQTTERQTIAIDRVSLKVRRGEFVCLLGPSGCGKSTLLNAVAGFEPLYAGSIKVWGEPVSKPGPDRAMVFQQPHLFPWKAVRSNIAHGPLMGGATRAEARALADRLIDMIGLGRFADSYPHELSGGMQQRVAIARALAVSPRILLMDEPFGALDAQTRVVMQENLLHLWSKINATILFVTHDIDEAILLADRVLVMTAGPGRILKDIKVDLPRPRTFDITASPAFVALKQECLALIRHEAAFSFSTQIV